MALENLKILVELASGTLQFNEKAEDGCITAMFNPNHLTMSTTVNWKDAEAAQRDNPEMQFTGCTPATITIDLFFDTYDTPDARKTDVRDVCTYKLLKLTKVQGDKHRPPICRLAWGKVGVFFQGVLTQMDREYKLFMEDGTPVRATVRCTFKQWRTNQEDFAEQKLLSSDVAKLWVLKQGETLANIAAREYGDVRKWRPIAEHNGIDNPMDLRPGTELVIPPLRAS